MALHSALTDPNLHEPKGVSTANAGQVYVADGAGSGAWTDQFPSMTGKSGYLLTNDGSSVSWVASSGIVARGTINISGTTPSVETGSVNIASVSLTTTGTYKITFTTPLSSTNYQVIVTPYSAALGAGVTTRNTTDFTVTSTNSATQTLQNLSTGYSFHFVVYGGS